jgi:anthranilate synthase/aminodeoxychorismate synthase-like glutamine amidotransferase
MLLVIDNYDSFTYNLVQYLGELGAELVVRRNDQISLADAEALRPAGLVISPGPGTPADAGVSSAVIRAFTGRSPILGVCLGHQCLGEVFGGTVERAPQPIHGKTSWVHHDGRGVFAGLPTPFEATRYHSLIVRREGLPDCLEVSAWTDDGLIMGLRHRTATLEGVQFHPESILTAVGKDLLRNFLALAGLPVRAAPAPAGPIGATPPVAVAPEARERR